jgi:hypothetical protein
VLKPRHFRTYKKSISEVLKCGAGERWRTSVELDRVKNDKVLQRVNEENITVTIKPRRRNCLLKHIIKGNIEGTGRRVRRCKQLFEDLKETRGHWKLKEHLIALSGEIHFKKVMDKLLDDDIILKKTWNISLRNVYRLVFIVDVQCAFREVQTEYLYIMHTTSGLQHRQYDRLKICGCQYFDSSTDMSPLSGMKRHGMAMYVMYSVNILHSLNVVTVKKRIGKTTTPRRKKA